MVVETVFGAVPLWAMILIAVGLGFAAIPLMFWREIKEWRASRGGIPVPDTQKEDTTLISEDAEAIKHNPGNGRRVIRLIMNASTSDEVDDLYSDFKSASHRTEEVKVVAACALKKDRLLSDDRETQTAWLWDLHEKVESLEFPGELAIVIESLEEEYPDG